MSCWNSDFDLEPHSPQPLPQPSEIDSDSQYRISQISIVLTMCVATSVPPIAPYTTSFENPAGDLKPYHREKCVEWISRMRCILGSHGVLLDSRSFHFAVFLMDRFCSINCMGIANVYLMLTACIIIALKMDQGDDHDWFACEIHKFIGERYSLKNIVLMETIILKELNFHLGYLTLFPLAPEEVLSSMGGGPTVRAFAHFIFDKSAYHPSLKTTNKFLLLGASHLLARWLRRHNRSPTSINTSHKYLTEYHDANKLSTRGIRTFSPQIHIAPLKQPFVLCPRFCTSPMSIADLSPSASSTRITAATMPTVRLQPTSPTSTLSCLRNVLSAPTSSSFDGITYRIPTTVHEPIDLTCDETMSPDAPYIHSRKRTHDQSGSDQSEPSCKRATNHNGIMRDVHISDNSNHLIAVGY